MIHSADYETILWLCFCAVCVALSAVFSGAETGMYTISRLRLLVAVHRKQRDAVLLQKLLADQPGLLSTTLLGTNLANYLAPLCLTAIFLQAAEPGVNEHVQEAKAELYTTLILTPIVFIFAELVPKNVYARHADRFLPRVARFLAISRLFFRLTGIIQLQRVMSNYMFRRLPHRAGAGTMLGSRFEMFQLLREGAADGALSRTQVLMLERVHKLQTVQVAQTMVPLAQVEMLPAGATREDVEPTIRGTRHSRLPVFDGDRQSVVGIVHVLDILTSPNDSPIEERARPSVNIGVRTTVLDALTRLQGERRRVGTIVDAAGRCVGIVTVKDLVEEIVGELAAW